MSWDWALLLLLLHGTLLAALIAGLVAHFRRLPRRESLFVSGTVFFGLLAVGANVARCAIDTSEGLRSCLFQGNLWIILMLLIALVSLNIRAYQLGVDQGWEEADAARREGEPREKL